MESGITQCRRGLIKSPTVRIYPGLRAWKDHCSMSSPSPYSGPKVDSPIFEEAQCYIIRWHLSQRITNSNLSSGVFQMQLAGIVVSLPPAERHTEPLVPSNWTSKMTNCNYTAYKRRTARPSAGAIAGSCGRVRCREPRESSFFCPLRSVVYS